LAGIYPALKRALDFLAAALGLALLWPVLAFVALAILLDDGRPVLFRQERVGRGGKRFRVFKFRTMVTAAESGPVFTSGDDPRITRAGRFLRRWSLDELPQLLNVLSGHMSLVGPRPTLPYQVERYDERQIRRLLVRPGITGLAQITGRNSLSWPERIELDLDYLENLGLWLDSKILFFTLPALVRGKTLYRGLDEWQEDPIAGKEARP
jgi:undecaprenyl phosphate N,N'-diacetylbacillosamine 1-phosphate transferase